MLTVPAWMPAAIRAPTAHVARPHRRVEAVLGVVGQPHGLVVGGDPVQRHHRAEGLLVAAGHRRGDALEHGRLDDERPDVGALAPAGEHAGALGDGVVDVGEHLLLLRRR